jgi:hypothetical protein
MKERTSASDGLLPTTIITDLQQFNLFSINITFLD